MDSTLPTTQYAESDELSIAYQVMGEGEMDLILMPALLAHVEYSHALPGYTDLLGRLSSFARVITFDKRGQGLSDRISTAPSLEERMDDIRTVMDAVGSEKAALLGFSDGGSMSCLFAATFPQKVHALILFGAFAKAFSTPDYPHMPTRDERMGRMQMWAENWGQGFCLKSLAPEMFEDEAMRNLYGRWERLSGTPNSMRKYFDVVIDTDVRPVLGSITVPTLVLHRRDDMQIPFAAGQHLADAIEGARLVDLGNGGHLHWNGDRERFAGEHRHERRSGGGG